MSAISIFTKTVKKPKQNKTCYRCGGNYPHKYSCPAFNKICKKCNRKGHFAQYCKTRTHAKPTNTHFQKFKNERPLNNVTPVLSYCENSSTENEDENYQNLFVLKSDKQCDIIDCNDCDIIDCNDCDVIDCDDCDVVSSNSLDSLSQFEAVLKLESEPVKFLVDSGSGINILNYETFCDLNSKIDRKLVLRKTKTKVITYGSDKPTLHIMGVIDLLIESKTKYLTTDFYVIKTNQKNILSGTAAIQLNILKFLSQIESEIREVHNDNENLTQVPKRLKPLIASFKKSLFSGKIGRLKDYQVKLHIDKNVAPVAQRERRIPYALRQKVKNELNKLEQQGIIEDVSGEPTPWLNPLVVVPKGENEIRVCLDMRNANTAITRTRYPTPTIDDLLNKLRGAKRFSKLDLKSAFHQLELDNESKYITTFQSEDKIKRFNRLIFGASSAMEELQHAIRTILSDIDCAINISDDILVFGDNTQNHDINLQKVLKRLEEKGLTLNLNKCVFDQESLEYFGFVFTSEGMKPSQKKIEALKNIQQPENVKAVRSFLGLANYLKRFIPNYSTITYPLRELTKHDKTFDWTEKCTIAFQKLKNALTENSCIAYFDEKKETIIYCDASPVGISSVILQKSYNKNNPKVIAYSSRSLTKAEQNYSQIERECLSITYACERNRLYLLGRDFTIYNDHKAIVNLLNNPNSTIPLRIERMILRIQGYNFQLKYVKSDENISDYMSRHPHDKQPEQNINEKYVNFVANHAIPHAFDIETVKYETINDANCKIIINLISTNQWYKLNETQNNSDFKHANIELLKQYRTIKNDLTINEDKNIILKGNRIVLPLKLQKQAVNLAHQGHQGIQKTKSLLRTKVFFFGMDGLVENHLKDCLACQTNSTQNNPEPIKPSELPVSVWHTVNIDYLGPLPNGSYILVLIDQRSRFPEIEILSSTNATQLIDTLEKKFSVYGLPNVVISDNGPPFKSNEVKAYMQQNSIKHRRVTPLWPRANGEVERFMRPLTKIIRSANLERKNWKSECYKFLMNYRVTPHSITKVSPADIMFGRKIRHTIPNWQNQIHSKANDTLQENDYRSKLQQQQQHLRKQYRQPNELQVGDRVIVKQTKTNKLSTNFNPKPYIIEAKKGSMITASNTTHKITRNSSHFKRIPPTAKALPTEEEEDDDDDEIHSSNEPPNIGQQNPNISNQNQSQPKQYPKRLRRPIHTWKKY